MLDAFIVVAGAAVAATAAKEIDCKQVLLNGHVMARSE